MSDKGPSRTVRSSTRPRKRKSPLDTSDQMTERKRAQNRISQQCARERQAAYVRQVESFMELLRANNELGDEDTKYSRLLKAHVDLMEQKRDMEGLLFHFRQKLLSVGSFINSAAEDDVFQNLTNNSSSSKESSSPTKSPVHSHSAINQTMPPEGDFPRHLDSQTHPTQSLLQQAENQFLNANPRNPCMREDSLLHINDSDLNQIPQPISYMAHNEVGSPTTNVIPGLAFPWAVPQLLNHTGMFDANALPCSFTSFSPPTVSQITLDASSESNNVVVISNSAVFADQVKSAAESVMYQFMEERHACYDPSLDLCVTDPTSSSSLVKKLASTAVEVIGALAGLGPYIYGVYFSNYMEYVFRWRLSNNMEDRLCIPQPFRPTPLQFATPNHPMVIDFINWPSIRDQMILYSAQLDLDAMCRDIVLNTVVELPQFCVSVNIYDLFFNYVLPRVRGNHLEKADSMLNNTEWVYLQVAPVPNTTRIPVSSSPTQQALATEIVARMSQSQSSSAINAPVSSFDTPNRMTSAGRASYGPKMAISRALASFGIDQPASWKLSKGFARKYPHIDCSLDVTRYEMVDYSAVDLDGILMT